MPATSALREQIVRLFADALQIEVSSVDTDLFESGILDSLAFVELLLQLERNYAVTASVDDLELDNFKSVARIADFVASRIVLEEPPAARIA